MKISNKILKLLHDHITMEGNASNYYLSVASWCAVNGYEGSANFFRNHSDEEREHMLKIVNYLNELKIHAKIPTIEEPSQNMKSLEEIVRISLQNEVKVTKLINQIVSIAQKEQDHRTDAFLEWFVNEQIEEEDLFETILQKFDIIGRDKLAVHEIDKNLEKLKDQK